VKIKDVAKLSPEDRFLYWIKTRHQIYMRRKAGKKKPWTDDEVLQNYFFTNPYRENDKVTMWFRLNVREPLRDNLAILMATVIFRWFNKIETGGFLLDEGLLTRWNEKKAVKLLVAIRETNSPVFTGAYMIKAGNGPPGCKIPNVCAAISNLWKDRHDLIKSWHEEVTMEDMHRVFMGYPHLGAFMAYEIVCDLRYTFFLENASDKTTWTNLGPGAKRGLARIVGDKMKRMRSGKMIPKVYPDAIQKVQQLMEIANRRLRNMPKFEMREIEHSLWEWDKYERAKLQDGKMKRKYQGT